MSIKDELLQISPPNSVPGIVVGCGDRFLIENNDWGAAGVPHQQSVHSLLSDGSPLCGWSWEYPELPMGKVLAFPEVIVGKKPWADKNDFLALPKLLVGCFDLEVDFSIRAEATGIYNLAFDLWLCDDPACDEEDIVTEFMVWLYAQGDAQPAGGKVASIELYDVFYGLTAEERHCVTYRSKALFNGGILPLGKLLQNAVEKHLIPSDSWLASVELGTEIWSGKGAAIVDQLAVRI